MFGSGNLLRPISIAILALLVVTPTLACSTTYNVSVITMASDEEARELYLKVALPTVLIRTENGSGSGVVFGDGSLVITAAHVISYPDVHICDDGTPCSTIELENVTVWKNEGIAPFVTGAQVIKINQDLDLAVLKLARAYPYAKATIASADPELYQKCWASGHPHGVTDPLVSEGRVQDLWTEGFILYSAPTTFGNSGGPVFIRVGKEYHVSSVVQRVFVEGGGVAVNHMGLGVLPSHLRDFVKEYAN